MADRFASIEEYLAGQSPERCADVEALRALVHQSEPRLIEIIKWNSPNYTLDGVDRLTINAAGKGPVRLILHMGAELAEDKGAEPTFAGDPGRLLTWHSNIRASLALPPADELEGKREAIVAVIRAWLAHA